MVRTLSMLALSILFLASILVGTDGSVATMSIDLGAQFIKIGLVKPGVPMEIVLNKESRRKTPFIVGFRTGERFFGDVAAQMSVKHPANTFTAFLDLLGKQLDNPIVTRYREQFPHLRMSADEERGTVVFEIEEEKFPVESLLAMLLWNAKEQTEAHAGQPVKDVVITIPSFFNQAERKAVANAAEIAGLNLLQLLTDGAAAGLNYGVFRRKEIKEQAQTLLIYDIGASKTTATIVEYRLAKEKNSKEMNPVMSTLGVGFNRTLGGNEITFRLRNRLVDLFNQGTKTSKPIIENPRAMAKMLKEAERVKQVLSANADHWAQIESVFEDKDFRAKVTRDELHEMMKDLEPYYLQPISDALRMAELTIDKVDLIVLMGAGTRVPRLQQNLQDFVNGKEIGRFLNTDEAIALGAVYQAAHLSKGFKVKKFDVQELQIYPLQVSFTSMANEDKQERLINRVLYGYKSYYPAAKKLISFTSHTNDFDLNLNYGDLSHLTPEQLEHFGSRNISKVEIKDVEATLKEKTSEEDSTFKGIKVHFRLDNYGILQADQAELVVEHMEKPSNSTLSAIVGKIGEFFSDSKSVKEGQVELDLNKPGSSESSEENSEVKKDQAENDQAANEQTKSEDEASKTTEEQQKFNTTETETPKKDSETTQEKEPAEEEKLGDKAEKKQPKDSKKETEKKVEPKPKVIKAPLKLVMSNEFHDLSKENVKAASKLLSEFEVKEKRKAEREAALNTLEASLYDYGSKLEEEDFTRFGTHEELESLRSTVDKLKTWLEDEVGPETALDDINEKKKDVDSSAKKLKSRKRQKEERPKYVETLESTLTNSTNYLETFKSMTGVFTEVELTTLSKVLNETKDWFDKKKEEQKKLADNQDPAFTVADLKEKINNVEREAKYLLGKMYTAKLKEEQEKLKKLKEEAEKLKNAETAEKEKLEKLKKEADELKKDESTSNDSNTESPDGDEAKITEPNNTTEETSTTEMPNAENETPPSAEEREKKNEEPSQSEKPPHDQSEL